MKFDPLAWRPLRHGVIVVGALAATGWAVGPLEQPAWEVVRATQPALRLDSLQNAMGQGITVGLLGGFRAILADFFWIKANAEWEHSEPAVTQGWLKLVTTIDPRPLYYWLGAARIMALDMPVWRINAIGPYDEVPAGVRARIEAEQAELAIKYLEEGLTYHPGEGWFYVDIAMYQMNKLRDTAKAAETFRLAAEQPHAPFLAGRIYAELLWHKLNRPQEAYDWLVKIYPTLPKAPGSTGAEHETAEARKGSDNDIETAQADIVLERIRALEKELLIPAEKLFKP